MKEEVALSLEENWKRQEAVPGNSSSILGMELSEWQMEVKSLTIVLEHFDGIGVYTLTLQEYITLITQSMS